MSERKRHRLNYLRQLPAAPTATSAIRNEELTEITVFWLDVANETGYSIELSLNGTNGWAEAGTAAQDATSVVVPSNDHNPNYYCRVRAFNAAGYGPYSNVVYAFIQA